MKLQTLLHLALGAWLASACSGEATQVLVTISAETQIAQRTDTVHIRILDSDGVLAREEDVQSPRFPITRALAPRGGDASRRYTVEATALQNNVALTTARVSGQYVAGRRLYVALALVDGCIGTNCTAPLTCAVEMGRAMCVPPVVNPLADAGLDASLDGSTTQDAPRTDTAVDAPRTDTGRADGCIPNCNNRSCGDDGCGGSCGPCAGMCLPSGMCAGPPNVRWTYQFTGGGDDLVQSVAVLSDRSVVVVGSFTGLGVHNGQNVAAMGGQAGFVARISATGTLLWDTVIDGSGVESADGVAVVGDRIAVAGFATAEVRAGSYVLPRVLPTGGGDAYIAFFDATSGAGISAVFSASTLANDGYTQFASDGTDLYASLVQVNNNAVTGVSLGSWTRDGVERWTQSVTAPSGYQTVMGEIGAQIGATAVSFVHQQLRTSPTCSDRGSLLMFNKATGARMWTRDITSTGCSLQMNSSSISGNTVAFTGRAGATATEIAPGMSIAGNAYYVGFLNVADGAGVGFRGACFQRFGHFDGDRLLNYTSSTNLIDCNGGIVTSDNGITGWISEGNRTDMLWYRNLGTGISGVADLRAYGDDGFVHAGYFSLEWMQNGMTYTPQRQDGYVQVRAP